MISDLGSNFSFTTLDDLEIAQSPSDVFLLVGKVFHEGGRLPGDVQDDALRHLDAVLGFGEVAVLEVEDVPSLLGVQQSSIGKLNKLSNFWSL